MQLVPVDEPAGGGVADLGVVLPAVPQPPDHLDIVGGLVEQVGNQLVDFGCRQVGGSMLRDVPAAEVFRLRGRRCQLDAHPRPAPADVVQRRDGLGHVERFGVGDHRGRHQTDAAGQRGDPGGNEDRVQPALYPVHPIGGGRVNYRIVRRQSEGVLDRDEVDQAAFGGLHEIGPVRGGEHAGGAGGGLAPGGWVPAAAVEGDGEMQGFGHGEPSGSSEVLVSRTS